MYIASADIKTAFDVARPKQMAKILGGQEAHGWITAALLREMNGLAGHAAFDNVSKFNFTRSIRQGSAGAATFWLKLANHILWNVEKEWMR